MKPAALLELAGQVGVTFRVGSAGTIRAKGGAEQINRLAPLIQEHKAELLAYLQESERRAEQSFSASAVQLPPDQERRAAEARVDWLEWVHGLERMTEEEAARVALFRKRDAALIAARGGTPYLDRLGIPRIPPDCEPKYRHWSGGQPLLDTLLEMGASDRVIDMRVTKEYSPESWRRWVEIKAGWQAEGH